jgi:cysteine sulfinate desulfinase/cysteine desulfurase-like protein
MKPESAASRQMIRFSLDPKNTKSEIGFVLQQLTRLCSCLAGT